MTAAPALALPAGVALDEQARRFVVTFEAVGGGRWTAPAAVRLRKLLKAASRSYGLRCVSVAARDGKEAAEQTLAGAAGENSLRTLATGEESYRRAGAAAEFTNGRFT